jgi:hypothetical protein
MDAHGFEELATSVFILVGTLKMEAAVSFKILVPVKLHGITSHKRIVIF